MTLPVNFVSDLHLDVGDTNPDLPGGRLLVLAGDVAEARCFKKYAEDPHNLLNDKNYRIRDLGRINVWARDIAEKYDDIIYIPGNHEHYHYVFDHTLGHLKKVLPENFHVFDRDCIEIDGVLFLCATLWTDMNRDDPITKHAIRDMMNDFSVIRKLKYGSYAHFTPEMALGEHLKTMQYFKAVLENPANKGKPVVVVSHHAPTALSLMDRYKNDFLMNGGYYSRLDDFILDHPEIKLWIHGHTHEKRDYMVGDHTRVVCNPRGYQTSRYFEDTGFDPNWTIEI